MWKQTWLLTAVGLIVSLPAFGQGRQQFQPPPDHWMTLDSLIEVVGVTADQRALVAEHYERINAVMKEAAEKRAELRAGMAGGPPTEADRERLMAFRDQVVAMQATIDTQLEAIHEVLTEEQQARFDELAKPQLLPQRRGPPQ